MEIKKLDSPVSISDSALVRLKEMGNITEIMYSEKRSRGGYITKIDKDHYVDNRTGELFEFKHLENRAQDLANVAKSLAQGRDILNANITDVSRCRWVTLTYADNMTDPKKLMRDFRHFNTRCREIFGHYEYITAAEPQGRGAWHLHCVFIFAGKAPYMENAVALRKESVDRNISQPMRGKTDEGRSPQGEHGMFLFLTVQGGFVHADIRFNFKNCYSKKLSHKII